jgi:hypothetical protein
MQEERKNFRHRFSGPEVASSASDLFSKVRGFSPPPFITNRGPKEQLALPCLESLNTEVTELCVLCGEFSVWLRRRGAVLLLLRFLTACKI